MKLTLEKATNAHTQAICDLVNLAYRGEIGWTKETALVDGDRATIKEIQALISKPTAHLLVAIDNNDVLSCICVEKDNDNASIGLFAVHPSLQGKGLGKAILSQAENYALKHLKAKKYIMVVVSQRTELISFYERRGYVRRGNIQNYPNHLDVGTPLVDNLTIEYLEKAI